MRKFNISLESRSNARAIFLQSLAQSALIYDLYNHFKEFTASPPKIQSSLIKETGNTRYNLSFSTRTLPCFNELYNLFYRNRVKVVPSNIEELLTPLSIAYWIMGDGSWGGHGVKLHTNNFTKSEVQFLSKVLRNKFKFSPSVYIINKVKSQCIIYIPSKDVENLKSLVVPYMLPSFLYKLGITLK